jgi:hypothetical protein
MVWELEGTAWAKTREGRNTAEFKETAMSI